MADNRPGVPPSSEQRRRLLYCPHCRNEFFTYKLTRKAECPVCHRPCSSSPPSTRIGGRRLACLVTLLILLALGWAVYALYLKDKLPDFFSAGNEPAASETAPPSPEAPLDTALETVPETPLDAPVDTP